jgi:hypothetical protein
MEDSKRRRLCRSAWSEEWPEPELVRRRNGGCRRMAWEDGLLASLASRTAAMVAGNHRRWRKGLVEVEAMDEFDCSVEAELEVRDHLVKS